MKTTYGLLYQGLQAMNPIKASILLLAIICFLLTGCRRDELCFFHPTGAYLVVEIDWDKKAQVNPNAATMMIYNADDGTLFREEILTVNRRHHILQNIPVGKYDIVVFNETRSGSHFDQTIGFRNHTDRDQFEAYVFPDEVGGRYSGLGFNASYAPSTRTIYTNPDTLSADRLLHYEVTPRMINLVHVDPEPLEHGKEYPISDTIRFTPERVISVVNVLLTGQNLRSIKSYSCYLAGMCESHALTPSTYSTNPVTHPVVFNKVNKKAGGGDEVVSLSGSFSVMGLLGDIDPHLYDKKEAYIVELRMVLLNGDIVLERYDLAKEERITRSHKFINGRPHDVIDIKLKVDLPDMPYIGGGIITDIEDWDDQTVHLETNVLRFHPNQGSGDMSPIRANINGLITMPECDFKAPTEPKDWKFRFKEWNTANDGKGAKYQPGELFQMPRGGKVIYAIWEKIE